MTRALFLPGGRPVPIGSGTCARQRNGIGMTRQSGRPALAFPLTGAPKPCTVISR